MYYGNSKINRTDEKKTLLSFELFPPKTDKGMENLPGTIEHLVKYKPEYISCTYGAGGGNVGANREVCQMIKKPELYRLLISQLSKTQKKESKISLKLSTLRRCRSYACTSW